MLTTGVDAIVGTSANDTINAIIDNTTNAVTTTLTALDTINGGIGADTMNLNVLNGAGAAGTAVAALPSLTISGVETLNIRSAVGLTANVSTWTDLTAANVTQGTAVALTGANTTALSVSGVTGAVSLEGGSSQTVTTAGTTVALGGTTVTTGAINVTHTAQAANAIAIDGGSNVTVTTTGSTAGATITVGQGGAATDLPTGTVNVSSAHKAVAGTDATLAAITLTGGTTITATQTADTSKAATDTTGATLTQGAVTITAGTATTSITSTQATAVKEVVGVTAVAGVTETASVKFGILKAGDTLTLDADGGTDVDATELTLTATVDMTAAQVAAAFANLINGTIPTAGDTQSGAAASKGIYDGASTLWTSAAASGDTVVFTSTTANSNVTNLAFVLTDAGSGLGVAPIVTTTAGSAATAAKTGVLGVINGTVVINDNATAASVTTISVNGYGASSTIGAANNVTKLANLTLANTEYVDRNADADYADADEAGDMTVNVGGTLATLNLTLNAVKGATTLTGAGLKTLNVTTTGADSSTALTAAAVETLTVAGTNKATFSADLAALKTVTVTGSASLVLSGNEGNTLTSVNTTGTTGAVSASIDGTLATYTGGAGVDTVTLVTGTALTKAISLGAGDDTLSFAALNVTGSTAAVNGGDGTDTLSMATATAAALDNAAQTFYTGFERLTINDAAGSTAIDLENLGFTNYVTTTGSTGTLTLNNLASNGTVVITTAPTTGYTIGVKDAATGLTDVVNVVVSSAGNLAAGTVTAANVETVKLTFTDTSTSTTNNDTMTLTAASATSVTVAGNSNVNLTMTGSTNVTSIDGSSMTKALTVTSLNTTSATTITGGSGNDVLTAATGTTADVLVGGAGDDTLTANAGLDTLTGGAGNDVFVIGTASLNSSSYATITDFAAGDLLQMTGADSFAASKVTQADTAVFQDYCNAAVNAIGANDVAWFQFNGNTYVVMDEGTTDSVTFINGEDLIVKLTGLVDLTNASFNNTHDTIAL